MVAQQIHKPPYRRLGFIFLSLGLGCVIISAFVSFIYLRPTNFKATYRQHQLADCLKTTTAASVCHARFDPKR